MVSRRLLSFLCSKAVNIQSPNISRVVEPFRVSSRLMSTHSSRPASRQPGTELVKSLNDKREYRYVVLDNGVRALLISDGEDDVEMETSDTESEGSGESDGEESEMEEDGSEDETEAEGTDTDTEKKSAAALCIGVGSFSDPDDIQGFAHFLEHMVFMGSEKYPKENDFDDYVSRHGGHTNAWTDHERTCFYFDVDTAYFQKSLDRFAQFFVSPLLLKDAVDREIQAVDTEFQESVSSDDERLSHIMALTAKQGHPMSKFLLGNIKSLKIMPEEKGINTYGRLREFFDRYYTAQYMTLAVHSKHSLDTLEAWTRESFSNIHNNKEEPLSFGNFKEPFDTEEFRKFYKVIPVKKTHKLYITWPLPALQHMYRVKPLEYIATVLNHEGEGSLYSYLKKRNWAYSILGGNSGSGCDLNTTWSGFDVCIKMTDTGVQHVNEIIRVVFDYITLMKKEGPQEWFFKELQLTEENKFRWKEQGDPTDYVEKVSDNMQLYPPSDVLTGHRLYFQYDPKVISECMGFLRVDNCNVMLLSSNYAETDCPRKEPWFGASYSVHDITDEQRKFWADVSENNELFLPKPNEFISTDFSLRGAADGHVLPRLVYTSDACKLYFKKDNKFNVPKGYAYFHLRSPVAFENVKSAALFDVFTSVLYHNISEPTYSALLAGYTIKCTEDDSRTGMVITVDGFNEKLKAVLLVVIDQLVQFTVSEEMFEAMKKELKKSSFNLLIKPSYTSRSLRWKLTQKCYWSALDTYQAMDSVTRPELQDLVNRFLTSLTIDGLVIGNFTEQEALSMTEELLARLPAQKPAEESVFHNQVVKIPRDKQYCQIASYNPEGTTSCITNYYQSGPGSMKTLCLNGALLSYMSEPCFNTLRTKHQLGYSVGCTNYLTAGILALGVYVECKAGKFSMKCVDGLIEDFLVEFKGLLENMTEKEFETLIESEITAKKMEDTHLSEEVSRHWGEILNHTYLFDRHIKEIAILEKMTKNDLVEWFQSQYFGENQRKLSVQVVGNQGSDPDQPCKPPSNADEVFKCLSDPEQTLCKPVQDVKTYRTSLPLLPHTKVIS